MPHQIIRIGTGLRQDLLGRNVARDVPRRIKQNSIDRGPEIRALIAPLMLADNDPRREDRPIDAIKYQSGVGSVDPNAFRRQPPRQPALALQVYLNLAQAVRRGLFAGRCARAISLQSLAQRSVSWRC